MNTRKYYHDAIFSLHRSLKPIRTWKGLWIVLHKPVQGIPDKWRQVTSSDGMDKIHSHPQFQRNWGWIKKYEIELWNILNQFWTTRFGDIFMALASMYQPSTRPRRVFQNHGGSPRCHPLFMGIFHYNIYIYTYR